jgi:hypothetical protein
LAGFHRPIDACSANAKRLCYLSGPHAPSLHGVQNDTLMLAVILLGRLFQVHAPGVPLMLDNMITALGTIIVALILVIAVLVRRIRVYRPQKQIDELG